MRTLVLPSDGKGSLEFKKWLAEKHDHPVEFFPEQSYGYGIIQVDDSERGWRIVLACVLQNFHFPGNILASYFADDPKLFFSKKLIQDLLDVPYQEPFNAHRVTMLIRTVHHRSIEVAMKYGFVGEAILKDHFGKGEDGTILRRLRPEYLED